MVILLVLGWPSAFVVVGYTMVVLCHFYDPVILSVSEGSNAQELRSFANAQDDKGVQFGNWPIADG